MSDTNQHVNDPFDRLQRLLLSMRAGDELASGDASRLTGLAEPTCRTVLERLATAGLMSHRDGDRFVRVTML